MSYLACVFAMLLHFDILRATSETYVFNVFVRNCDFSTKICFSLFDFRFSFDFIRKYVFRSSILDFPLGNCVSCLFFNLFSHVFAVSCKPASLCVVCFVLSCFLHVFCRLCSFLMPAVFLGLVF